MKGKLNRDVSISDNEMALAGTYVENLDVLNGYKGVLYQCKLLTGKQIMFNSNKVDITDYSPRIDWEQRRYEIAKSAMQGMLAHSTRYRPRNPNMNWHNAIAEEAKELADALIKELKKG